MANETIASPSLDQLFAECKNRNLNISVSSQRINDFAIEIYTGYKTTYKLLFYTDGHLHYDDAIQEAFLFLNSLSQNLI